MGQEWGILFKDFGIAASLGLAAAGSALGTGYAAMSAVGAMKKCFAQSKKVPFVLFLALIGAPLTQLFYGFILSNKMAEALAGHYLLGMGIFGGLAMGASAMMQGKAAAGACDAVGETGKGFGNFLIILGIIETVALLVMIFMMLKVDALMGK